MTIMRNLTLICFTFTFAYLIKAERDFSFNNMQIPLLEPKDNQPNITPRIYEHPYTSEILRCTNLENDILLSLVLKQTDWRDMSDIQRTKVLDKLSQFFAIPKEFLTFETVNKRDINEMFKESIRKGNNKCQNNNRGLGRVNFMIGCEGSYFTMTTPIANQIGHQIKDGSIDNITGVKFGCWAIWRKQFKKSKTERNRRETDGSGLSGLDEDQEYDYDDESVENETEEPMSKSSNSTPINTTLISSILKETSSTVPTPTHAHRHHHGDQQPESSTNEIHSINNFEEIRKKNNYDELNKEEINSTATTTIPDAMSSNKNNNNVYQTIVESVSQLESVITKTIENTENINEIPVEMGSDKDNSIIGIDVSALENKNISQVDGDDMEKIIKNNDTLAFKATEIAVNSITKDSFNYGSLESTVTKKPMEIPIKRFNLEQLPTDAKLFKEVSTEDITTINILQLLEISTTEKSTEILEEHVNISKDIITTESDENTLLELAQSSMPPMSTMAKTSLIISNVTTSLFLLSSTTPISTDSFSNLNISTTTSSDIISEIYLSKPTTTNILPSSSSSFIIDFSKYEETTTTMAEEQQNNFSTTTSQQKLGMYSSTTHNPSMTRTKTPTSISTDYGDLILENATPIIKTRLQKFAVTSGKLFTYLVPAETFYDPEDKTKLRLQLSNKDGQKLSTNSWLQFNTETHEIVGLPLDDAVSRWQYRLTATDSGKKSVTETLEMTVQQHRGVRSVNHEISIVVQRQEGTLRNIDWQINLVKAIASVLGETNTDGIVVREVRQFPNGDANTATFVYFNETLPTSKCPESELTSLIKSLQVTRLQELVEPTLKIKQVTGQLISACQKQLPAIRPKPTSTVVKNVPPQPRNQVDRVNATAGHLLVYKVPGDTFYDDHELTLRLRTKENRELNARHWLQFDSKNQEFYGIPMTIDIGTEEYLLVAENTLGLSANDALVVVVSHATKRDYIAYFKAYLGIRHEQFTADLQRKFVERIALLFGDSGTQFIHIRSVTTQHDAGSTIVYFHNTTLYKWQHRCPEALVVAARTVYLMPDNSVRERVKQILGPELNLTNLQIHNVDHCNGQTDIIHREYPTAKGEAPTQSAFGETYMTTIVYPAVVIVTIIFIAALIACCVHKRRRKSGKMELGDEEERKSFRTKGIPVIFQDELDEKPEIGNKSPIIMKNEKPPLLPPSYNTSNLNGDNDVDEYVPPPAVIVGGREVRGKSPATPSYRKPPPYVSP